MLIDACHSEAILRDFVAGFLTDDDSSAVSRHLESCETCVAVATRLESSGDSLMRHLKLTLGEPAGVGAQEEDTRWAACVRRLKELPTRREIGTSPDAQPARVHHYRLLDLLGRGGMGVVYRSWHPQLHKDVAIKLLAATRAGDTQAVLRFQREMRAAGHLDHPAIVRALDAGESDGANYLVMELVDGVDFSKVVRRCGPLSVADACQVSVEAAEALHYAHQQGVVHRDVKPSNIMLTRSGHIKLLDFGLAALHAHDETGDGASSTGRLLGTLDYISPEQASGSGSVGPATDIYSLGATLFKLLTAQPPHSGGGGPLLRQLRTICESPCPRIDQLRRDVPVALSDCLQKMLATEPQRRFATAQDAADALRPFAANSQLALLAEDAGCESSGAAARQAGASNSPPTPRSPRWALLIAASLLGLAVGVAGVVLWLNTGEGRLEIISDVDDVSLSLLRGGESRPLEVSMGKREVLVRAGKHEVRIAGRADRLIVAPNVIHVKRGSVTTIRVTLHPASATGDGGIAAPGAAPATESWAQRLAMKQEELRRQLEGPDSAKLPSADAIRLRRELDLVGELMEQDSPEPMFQGRSFRQWRLILRRETDLPTLRVAVDAMLRLGLESRPAEAFETLATTAERLDVSFPHADEDLLKLVRPEEPKTQRSRRGGPTRPSVHRPAPVHPWRDAMASLVSGADSFPESLRDELIERCNQSPGARKLLLVLLHSKLQHGRADDSWRAQLAVQASCGDGGVRSLARYLQIQHRLASDGDIRAALSDSDDRVLLAALDAIHDAKEITHPQPTGAALARLVAQLAEDDGGRPESLRIRLAQFNAADFPKPQMHATLAEAARVVVARWAARQGDALRTLPGAMFCGGVASAGAMDDATAAKASGLLRQAIELQLALRKSYVPTGADDRAGLESSLFAHLIGLAKIDGWLPDSVLAAEVDRESPLGKAFHQWKESSPKDAGEPPLLLLSWFPVECIEAALHREAEQLTTFMSSREALLGLITPRLPSWLVVDLAIPIAILAEDDAFDAPLWLLLKELEADWIPRPRMEQELWQLAHRTSTSALRREAFEILLRAGRRQADLAAAARSRLKRDGEMNWHDDWILDVYLASDNWTLEEHEAAKLMTLAQTSFEFCRMASQRGIRNANPAELVRRTRAALQLVSRIGQPGEPGEGWVREILLGRGPNYGSPEYLAIGVHPELLDEALRLMRALGPDLAPATKDALRQLRARVVQFRPGAASDSELITMLKAVDDTIQIVEGAAEETDKP